MARNYKISEAVEIIAEGTDLEAIQDLGRRYPLLVAKVAKATSGSNVREVVELFSYMPEYLSANKVNKAIRENAGLIGDKDSDDIDTDADEKPVKKEEKKTAEKPEKKGGDPYAGKDAVELFKECKKRGIKAAPKKTAKFYANLLKKADEEAAEADTEEAEDDDWDDDDAEDEDEAPKKATKKGKKPAKKEEPEEDDDDDDDWDI